MADEHWQLAIVPQVDACPSTPCPFCDLGIGHNATKEQVLEYCFKMASWFQGEFVRASLHYDTTWRAVKDILFKQGIRTVSMPTLHMSCELLWTEHTLLPPRPDRPQASFPRATPYDRPSRSAGSWQRWSGHGHDWRTSSSSASAEPWTTVETVEEKYPKWQFEGGKKMKWTDYDADSSEALEMAYLSGRPTCDLEIDEWLYSIDFLCMTQLSTETGKKRGVRRLTEPA